MNDIRYLRRKAILQKQIDAERKPVMPAGPDVLDRFEKRLGEFKDYTLEKYVSGQWDVLNISGKTVTGRTPSKPEFQELSKESADQNWGPWIQCHAKMPEGVTHYELRQKGKPETAKLYRDHLGKLYPLTVNIDNPASAKEHEYRLPKGLAKPFQRPAPTPEEASGNWVNWEHQTTINFKHPLGDTMIEVRYKPGKHGSRTTGPATSWSIAWSDIAAYRIIK